MNNAFLILFLFLCNIGWWVAYLTYCDKMDSLKHDAPFHVFAVPLIIALVALFICGFINAFMVWAVVYSGGV